MAAGDPTAKGKSPFYPTQPVPPEFFTGRAAEISHILQRGVGQVKAGKMVTMYVQGEYGIGKSSLASFTQQVAERSHNLHGIYVTLGGAKDLGAVGTAILEGTVRSGAYDPTKSEAVRKWLAKYIGEQTLFSVTVRADALEADGPNIARGLLPFLDETIQRLAPTGVKGIFLILDEINGIASVPEFSHFIKGIVDTNAVSKAPVPVLLMLCGTPDRRTEMISCHQPMDRIFDVIDIKPMSKPEMKEFFQKAFASAKIEVDKQALEVMVEYAAGLPKIMHLIGDSAFWLDQDGKIESLEAVAAVINAAEELGKRYVGPQVYDSLRSDDYKAILRKIASLGLDDSFKKKDVEKGLTDAEKKKFGNFLQRMKDLEVLRPGSTMGEYTFNMKMVRVFIFLDNLRATQAKVPPKGELPSSAGAVAVTGRKTATPARKSAP